MKKTICLNMIVKNESHVIKRCLNSVQHLIDYWVIVDTGSTDGTQAIIRDYLKGIPGELHERAWVNFGHNRNEALDLARGKADYFLFIDADDRLVFSKNFVMPDLDKEFYLVQQHMVESGEVYQPIVLMVQDLPDYSWAGVLHEGIPVNFSKPYALLTGVTNEYLHDGARSKDPAKHLNDAKILKQALREDPDNARNIYYLAQSYAGAKKYPTAIKYYEKRAAIGGDSHETYFSYFYMANLQSRMKEAPETIVKNFCKAYLNRPTRAEPLFYIAGKFIEAGNHFLGYLVAEIGLTIPVPVDVYVEPWIYEWGIHYAYFVCAHECGYNDEALAAAKKLFAAPSFPPDRRAEVEQKVAHLKANRKAK